MHRVLERQIKRHLGGYAAIAPKWRAFFESVSKTYTEFDKDLALLGHARDLSSKELRKSDRRFKENKLKAEKKSQNIAFGFVKRTKESDERIAELEDVRKAMGNLLEDFKEEQKALAEAKAKDEAILASIADGCIFVNTNGEIILINQKAQEMLGYTSQESIGKQWHEILRREDESGKLIPPGEGAIRAALLAAATTVTTAREMKRHVAFKIETILGRAYYYVRKNKTRFPVTITVAPVTLRNKVIGAIEVFRDITKEKEIDKAKSEFVSLASHQLRTPLSVISWYAEMLIAGDAGQLNKEQENFLGEIYKGNQRMVELVNTFLNVSRLELGTFIVEPKPTDLKELVESVFSELSPKIRKGKLEIIKKYATNLPKVSVDQKLMRMIIQNLLTNAVKYTPSNGRVILETTKDDVNFKIIVTDTGYGIPKDVQDKIFIKLFRADNARERSTDGTGLGLYIVKLILDHTGGKISFTSEENKGTTFEIIMPLSGMRGKESTKFLS